METEEILFMILCVSLVSNFGQYLRSKDLQYWKQHWETEYNTLKELFDKYIDKNG